LRKADDLAHGPHWFAVLGLLGLPEVQGDPTDVGLIVYFDASSKLTDENTRQYVKNFSTRLPFGLAVSKTSRPA
jgi:hypothetical protein